VYAFCCHLCNFTVLKVMEYSMLVDFDVLSILSLVTDSKDAEW
jgi:hypothetical protein